MQTLTEILKQMEVLRPAAERLDIEMPRATLPALMIAKRQSQDEIDRLRKVYQTETLNKLNLVLVTNDQDAGKVDRLLTKSGSVPEVVAINADGFYSSLATNLEKSIGSTRRYLPGQCASLSGMLVQEAKKVGVFEVNQLSYQEDVVVPDYAAAVALVRNVVQRSNGDVLNVNFITSQILQEAESMKFSGDKLTVLLHGVDPSEVLAFKRAFPSNSVLDLSGTDKFDTKTVSSLLGVVTIVPPVAPADSTPKPTATPEAKTETKQKKE
jgi:hypothetical protein